MKKKRKLKIIPLLTILGIIGAAAYLTITELNAQKALEAEYAEAEKLRILEEERLENVNNCLIDTASGFNPTSEYNIGVTNLTNSAGTYSVIYKELVDDNLILGTNLEHLFYGESTVKLPFAIYIYELAKSDPSILTKELYFKESNRVGGSGIMQNMDLSRSFSVKELVKYMVEESDNIAFYMLLDEFPKVGAQEFWEGKGAYSTFDGTDKFGHLKANDALIYMQYAYNLIKGEDSFYDELLTNMINANKSCVNCYFNDSISTDMYFKYGGPTSAYHELAIVNDEKPYILIVLTEIANTNYASVLPSISLEVSKLHDMYWDEKNEFCENKFPKKG